MKMFLPKDIQRACKCCLLIRGLMALICLIAINSTALADSRHKNTGADARPGVLLSTLLAEIPGKRLVVIELNFEPNSKEQVPAHRHPGSVYVYVTQGSVRFAINDEPARKIHAGQGFFEPAGALHTVAENASKTEPAKAIAVMILSDGAPLLTVE